MFCFWLPQVVLALILYVVGWMLSGNQLALSLVFWGIGLRTVLVFHATWFVNSAAHTWGYQSSETGDNSRNLWWVGLLTLGEGWHNNHHYDPRSARHGIRWFEFDATYWTIIIMSRFRLTSKIRKPKRLLTGVGALT